MKSYNRLYPKIFEFENLHKAYLLARRNKRYKRGVLEFGLNMEEFLIQIQNELIWKTYQTGDYHTFYVYEPKKREINALAFKDRVVQHALNSVIEPIFDRIFIYDSYACRKKKGIHGGVERTTQFLQKISRTNENIYILKADIEKYFQSVDHKILYQLITRKIKCRDTLWLIREIIDSGGNRGIPIGNLTSQLFANIYLNQLDHFIKEELGVRYYIRYMDDFIILDKNKMRLQNYRITINQFLVKKLHIRFNERTAVFPSKQGIDFLGYRIWKTHRLLRTKSIIRFKRKLRFFQRKYRENKLDFDSINFSIQSWIGHAKHANTYNLRKNIFNDFRLVMS